MTMLPKPIRREKPFKGLKRSKMNRVGPRTKRRTRATALLRKTVDPTYCELRREGCTLYGTDWAHSMKSRKLQGDDWTKACRSCRSCHTGPNGIEHLSPEGMKAAVLEAISRRSGAV